MNEKKRIVVTGATGFIGRALVLALRGRGREVIALVRRPDAARAVLPDGVDIRAMADGAAVVAGADAIVHLAGESLAGGRWTRARKAALRASRVDLTTQLVGWIAARSTPLPVLVSASAVGWYGDPGERTVSEEAAPGAGFAAELCRDWEAAVQAAAPHAVRIVRARLGVVLGPEGGALGALVPLARWHLAGPIAGGAQHVSWIHLDDAVRALVHAVDDDGLTGPVNLVAPRSVSQRELAAALAQVLGRRAQLPAPGWAVRLVLGQAASLLVGGQRVVPAALTRRGFTFLHPELQSALVATLAPTPIGMAPVTRAAPTSAYLSRRAPRYQLHTRTVLAAPMSEVFPFFAAAANLGALTPPKLAFSILSPDVVMAPGAIIDYRIALSGVPMRWRTEIEDWDPGQRFVDVQLRGPYRAWWHEHRFYPAADGQHTVMEDTVLYALPAGPLGWLAHRLVVGPMLRRIFTYRAHAIGWRFPPPVAALAATGRASTALEPDQRVGGASAAAPRLEATARAAGPATFMNPPGER